MRVDVRCSCAPEVEIFRDLIPLIECQFELALGDDLDKKLGLVWGQDDRFVFVLGSGGCSLHGWS